MFQIVNLKRRQDLNGKIGIKSNNLVNINDRIVITVLINNNQTENLIPIKPENLIPIKPENLIPIKPCKILFY